MSTGTLLHRPTRVVLSDLTVPNVGIVNMLNIADKHGNEITVFFNAETLPILREAMASYDATLSENTPLIRAMMDAHEAQKAA